LGLSFVRLINHAELDHMLTNGVYASFAELAQRGYFERVETDTSAAFLEVLGKVNTNDEAEPIPGWELMLLVSPDKGSYSVLLRERNDGCAITLSSDQRRAIHETKTPECTR
jgi:hypothetical protein